MLNLDLIVEEQALTNNGEAGFVNDREKLIFRLKDDEFGDATEAYFDFAEVRGTGEVEVLLIDDGALIGAQNIDATSGYATVGLDGQRFDKVKVKAVDDTAFSLDGFGCDRIAEDEFFFV